MLWYIIGGLLLAGLGFRLSFPNSQSVVYTLPASIENPLPPCPNSPNCVRESQSFSFSADEAYTKALAILEEGASFGFWHQVEQRKTLATARSIHAVFKVGFFKDDFLVQVETMPSGSVVHLRSASRVGHGDMGVNGRRAKAFWAKMRQ